MSFWLNLWISKLVYESSQSDYRDLIYLEDSMLVYVG